MISAPEDLFRARAFEENLKDCSGIFSSGSKEYAIQKNAHSDPVKLRQLNSFFFWKENTNDRNESHKNNVADGRHEQTMAVTNRRGK